MSDIRPEKSERAFPHLDEWGLSKWEYFFCEIMKVNVARFSFSSDEEAIKDASRYADMMVRECKARTNG